MSAQWSRPVGFCGRCGAPLFPGQGPNCTRCGAAVTTVAAAAVGYHYPAMPQQTIRLRRMSHVRLIVTALVSVAVLVAGMSAAAFLVRPQDTTNCGPSGCPPPDRTRLVSGATYHNDTYGFEVDYPSSWSADTSDPNGVTLSFANGNALIRFRATPEQDLGKAVDKTVAGLPSSKFQSISPIGDIRGARIGFVEGKGRAYTASYIDSAGSGGQPLRLAAEASAHGGVTVTALMISPPSQDVSVQPYGIAAAQEFDFPITNFRWKGDS